jgi:hypothetical protein
MRERRTDLAVYRRINAHSLVREVQPGDEQQGGWTRHDLRKMDEAFARAMQREASARDTPSEKIDDRTE